MDYGIICAADQLTNSQLTDFAARAEASNLDQIWVPELFGRDPFITCGTILNATSSIKVGTAIANVYARDARATKAAAYSLADQFDNRFELGLGVSNKVGNSTRGHTWLPPVIKLKEYLDGYDASELMFPNDCNVPVYLAAHGPKLMDLAASRLDGAFSYLMTLDYTSEARSKLGDKKLHLMQTTVFREDPGEARRLARRAISIYMPLENYHRAWRERGFKDADFSDGGSDGFIDAIIAWGNIEDITERYAEQGKRGADQIIILPVGLDLSASIGWQQIMDLNIAQSS